MLRTYFQQNKDWFTNFDHPFNGFEGMDDIAELRSISKVTRLRNQIECREEGAWMVVKDVPDQNAPSGSRKVTAYGRTTRSVVHSVTTNSDFGKFKTLKNLPDEPLVQHPVEEDEIHDSKPTSVEITEVFDEPLRGNVLETDSPTHSDKNNKKTSVVTLGEGNIVLLDPEESNFKVTGLSKSKVADAISTFEKKPKKVGFSKTEVHFAPDSGKINIVETDEKPPPTQIYRRKKRHRTPRKTSNCLPKHYFGDFSDSVNDLKTDTEQEDYHLPASPPEIKPVPRIKEIFPTFEKNIKSEGKDNKYRHSSPEKSDFESDKNFDDKEFLRKIKQPAFREKFLKENETLSAKTALNFTSFSSDYKSTVSREKLETKKLHELISRNEALSKEKFPNVTNKSPMESGVTDSPMLRYTELFKVPIKIENIDESSTKSDHDKLIKDNNKIYEQPDYGLLKKPKSISIDEKTDFYSKTPRVPIDQDIKPDPGFFASSKLQSLIQNSVEHEFQLRLKQILQKRSLEKDTHLDNVVEVNNVDTIVQKKVESIRIKKEDVAKNILSEESKDSELQKKSYLLSEEPVPAPRGKPRPKSPVPPKPKPRTILSSDHRPRTARISPRIHSNKSDTSSLSRKFKSKENLSRHSSHSHERTHSSRHREEGTIMKKTTIKSTDSLQTRPKTSVQLKKTTPRGGEPLRSFEKVSNGWVGVVASPRKEPIRTTTTSTSSFSLRGPVNPSSLQSTGSRRTPLSPGTTTGGTTVRSSSSVGVNNSSRTAVYNSSTVSSKPQFSLSREHLNCAKLVKKQLDTSLSSSSSSQPTAHHNRPTARVKPVPHQHRSNPTALNKSTTPIETAVYGRLRRTPNENFTTNNKSEQLVKKYSFSSPPKVFISKSRPCSVAS